MIGVTWTRIGFFLLLPLVHYYGILYQHSQYIVRNTVSGSFHDRILSTRDLQLMDGRKGKDSLKEMIRILYYFSKTLIYTK